MRKIILLLNVLLILQVNSFSQVAELWSANYGNAYDSTDRGEFIIRGDLSSVIVAGTTTRGSSTGMDVSLTKYDRNGVMLWQTVFSGNEGYYNYDGPRGLVSDAQGNIFVCVLSIFDVDISGLNRGRVSLIKYNPFGIQLWLRSYQLNGFITSGMLGSKAMSIDNQGNPVYSMEYVDSTEPGERKMVTLKYNSNGDLLWSHFFNGPVPLGFDRPYNIITDMQNNVYVAARSDDSCVAGYCSNIVLIKYNSQGVLQWTQRLSNIVASPVDMSIDVQGNIYILGWEYSNNTLTVKINDNGTVLWTKYYRIRYFPQNLPSGLTTDASGFVYIYGWDDELRSSFIGKYNSDGDSIWVSYDSTLDARDFWFKPSNFSVDGLGNIYISGNTYSAIRKSYACKYNVYGDKVWGLIDNRPEVTQSFTSSHVIDNNGNMYITGFFGNVSIPWGDMFTRLYSQSPSLIAEYSSNELNLPINDNQDTYSTYYINCTEDYLIQDINLEIDTVIHTNVSDLEFYLTHNGITDTLIYSAGGTGSNFINTVLDDSATMSVINATAPFTGTFKPQSPLSIFNGVPAKGEWELRIYDRAAGNTGTLQQWSMKVIMSTNPTGINEIGSTTPNEFSLSQNYPNPFNPSTSIRYRVSSISNVSLKVYDVLGKEVATLVYEEKPAGNYEVQFDGSNLSSGVYFYQLKSGEYIDTKKFVLLK